MVCVDVGGKCPVAVVLFFGWLKCLSGHHAVGVV
jgi:hypothetical protein